jgi:hypothetical protein
MAPFDEIAYEAHTRPGAAEIQVIYEGTAVADFFTDSSPN